MTFALRTQVHVERPWGQRPFSIVGAFSMITNLRMELFEALVSICSIAPRKNIPARGLIYLWRRAALSPDHVNWYSTHTDSGGCHCIEWSTFQRVGVTETKKMYSLRDPKDYHPTAANNSQWSGSKCKNSPKLYHLNHLLILTSNNTHVHLLRWSQSVCSLLQRIRNF